MVCLVADHKINARGLVSDKRADGLIPFDYDSIWPQGKDHKGESLRRCVLWVVILSAPDVSLIMHPSVPILAKLWLSP